MSFKDKDTFEEVLSRDKYEIKPDMFIVVDRAAGKGNDKGKKGELSSFGYLSLTFTLLSDANRDCYCPS